MAGNHELKSNEITAFDSVIMGIAGTAPAYTISASTGALIAAVGVMGPGSILYAAVVMFGIAFAFMYLNKWRSDAGASYAWVGRAIHPALGFMSGWALIVATCLFMVAGSLPVGTATLDLIAPSLANNVVAVTIAGAFWFLAMNTLIMLGIQITTKFQKYMTMLEVGILLIIAVAAFLKFGMHPVKAFSWSWFSPMNFNLNTFMSGSLIAIFYYWGWDVTANLTEETKDRNRAPGYGGVFGMIGIFVLFELMQIIFQMGLTTKQITTAGANLLPVIGNMIFPRPWGDIALIAVTVSTIATLETSLLQASRTLFSMGRDHVLGEKFGHLHHRFQTPWLAGIVMGIVSLLLFVISSFSSGVNVVMTDAITAIGLQICFYYGLTGFACAWYYRHDLLHNFKTFVMRGLWPVLSAMFLWTIAIYDIPLMGWQTDVIGLGTLALGLIPLLYYRFKLKSHFYSENRETSRVNPVMPAADNIVLK
ncbi:APC family permease [Sporolactobacillus spathodeae]|uniref:Amino acid transporter n=1 Tax=Sporolactobacillus spathodeae TaxID=1465502 RepID=A0ABS2QBA4_9BACL|nr:APC family permease [Sporolactobacillus spathodeae]MBM7658434.1 amino acid transporter [Sporolactobacillus spathodeae]